MEIINTAIAGTLESSDVQVIVEPATEGIEIELESTVINQYGKQIRTVTMETLQRLQVKNAKLRVIDKGALDCTLKARVECAIFRSNHIMEQLPWGGAIR